MSWQATKAVMEHSQAKGAARLVLCVLAYHATPAGECSPSPGMGLICQEANLSERGAQQAIRKLEEIGEIVTQIGRGKGNLSSYKICLPIKGEAAAKGARIAPLQPEEKGQSVPDGPVQKGQTIPQKGQSVPEKGQNPSPKGAIRAAHIGRTVLNRHEPLEPTTEQDAPFDDFSDPADSAHFAESNAMNDFLMQKYSIVAPTTTDPQAIRNFRKRQEAFGTIVRELRKEHATPDLLRAFFAQRKVLPDEKYIICNFIEWLPKHMHALAVARNENETGGNHAQSQQRPRETHNGRNARLTLQLLGIEPQLSRSDLGVPDSDDEPAARLALVERGGRRT